MSNRSVIGLFINPAHQSRMMPGKYKGIMMEIKYYGLDKIAWDSE